MTQFVYSQVTNMPFWHRLLNLKCTQRHGVKPTLLTAVTSVPGSPVNYSPSPPAKRQRPAQSAICFCLTFHINVTYRNSYWCWQVICVCGMQFYWRVCGPLDFSLHPSRTNTTSSRVHQSTARKTAVLHRASRYSLSQLPPCWASNNVFGAPQSGTHPIPFFIYFLSDTWVALLFYSLYEFMF